MATIQENSHHSPEFRKEWSRFDNLTDHIDPHIYEVTHVIEGSPRRAAA